MADFTKYVRKHRQKKGWTQAELAAALGDGESPERTVKVSPSWISRLEGGRISDRPSEQKLRAIHASLGCDLRQLQTLPMRESLGRSKVESNLLSDLSRILQKLTPQTIIQLDTPADGPASLKNPIALEILFRILFLDDIDHLKVFSNTPSRTPDNSKAQKLHGLVLSAALLAVASQAGFNRQNLDNNPTPKTILQACTHVVDILNARPEVAQSAPEFTVPTSLAVEILDRIHLYSLAEPPGDRYNPYTYVLMTNPPFAFAVQAEARYDLSLIDPQILLRHLDLRRDRGTVKRERPTEGELADAGKPYFKLKLLS